MVNYTLSWAVSDTVTVGVSAALARRNYVGMWRALNSGVVILLVFLLPLMVIFLAIPRMDCDVVCRLRSTEDPGACAIGIFTYCIGRLFRDCRRFAHNWQSGIERLSGYESANADYSTGLLGNFHSFWSIIRIRTEFRCPRDLDRANSWLSRCCRMVLHAFPAVGTGTLKIFLRGEVNFL